jgi:hypothetical protein
MNLTLVMFGTNENGLWNQKRYSFKTIADAVEVGDSEDCDGYVVLASWYEEGKNMDEVKVVYEENTEDVSLVTFPHIGVYSNR